AAATKWNFLPFTPGLVGGHCVGVDPYYLTDRAEREGYHPEVILAGRRINHGMGTWIARETIKRLLRLRPDGAGGAGHVCVLGLTFKADVPDCRNSRVPELIEELRSFGARVQVADALADPSEVEAAYGLRLVPLAGITPGDAVVLAVPHRAYRAGGWTLVRSLLKDGRGLVTDVAACLDRAAAPPGVHLWRP
ncbi:MAG TPA: UDP binding domain-containing protein, partial [Rhodospirillales bacterium]|nr:UDP binding domain-containing protein [Rhodospirillales bacterium]